MHLDLSRILPAQAVTDIENVAAQYGHICPDMMWPLRLNNVDTEITSVNILQAGAQLLSSYGCVLATLRFGLYCSRYFPKRGAVLSDDVALYYLRNAFWNLSEQQGAVLKWIQKAEGFEYGRDYRNQFWIQACAAYAHHEYDENPAHLDATLEFAFQFLLSGD